ncbi:DNA polymerase III subunit delta' [Psychroserpens sp.]|uniref:DNA polymerase III subunit n=1 Tax=Psychroserpens sp. TaxID=2020870 RepID=UPI001B1A21AC|nr:DNA polymerase III subunit delta' [Psychroserpens sp.]MBO6605366.1 DNA polymerase III subunit delta' [Psychroserpens sp.]MBO6631616.1 DNA polymerase III subunit delta' [Psychroserpens sp.]MBO6653825.1 DNA polymerase III subunit delta' [Psychroserpens sp.]MBO6682146.1 DNA polymerase III subunit delta' [Psychroserpens sp.]MBO6748740.1 DNA polymerase III subunit delta' [Psychroserpens sp.]
MLFSEILGQDHIKNHLTTSADFGRIPHAQLFVGPEGSGTLPMAIAYAQYLLCKNTNGENSNGNETCNLKFKTLAHPDLHFAFPVATNDRIKSHPVSSHFLEEWRQLIDNQPYGNLFDWYRILGIDNKQGQIGVDEAHDIVKSLSLKSYEGGYKVMIIWMAEKMNTSAANKLLKLIEEPPNQTIFILIAEDEEQIINTIRSRCQILNFPPLAEATIQEALIKHYQIPVADALKIAHQANGNYNKACDLVYSDSEDTQFEEWFVFWIRSAFKAKGNKSAIHDLISWSETIAKSGRETQKQFLNFCLDYFRQALLLNYKAESLVFMEPKTGFKLEKFAPFVHGNNIMDISNELQDAIYHIERNGNSKIILTDLSIKLTRLLHKKAD